MEDATFQEVATNITQLKLLLEAPTEEARVKAKAAGCYYSNMLTETKTEGRLISRTRAKTYWACFAGPYIALHDSPPKLNDVADTPTAVDFVVLSPQTTFQATADTTFTLSQIFQNRSTSMKPEASRTFGCTTEREREEWRCAIQGVVDVLRGDFSLPTTPAQPCVPRVESIKHDAVRLSWTKGDVASTLPTLHYRVCTRKERDAWSEPVLVHASTPFIVIRDLLPGMQYAWRVCATNVLGQGEWSESSHKVSTLRVPQTPPSAPKVLGRGTRTATLEWNGATSGAKQFWGRLSSPVHSIQVSAYVIGHGKETAAAAATSKKFNETVGKCVGVVDGLEPGTSYVFRACAVSYAGNGAASKFSAKCRTLGKPESGPKVTTVVNHTHDTVTLKWKVYGTTKNEAAINGYHLEYEKESESVSETKVTAEMLVARDGGMGGGGVQRVVGADSTTCTISQLLPNTRYRFRIAATNEIGLGPACDYGKYVHTMRAMDVAPAGFAVQQTSRTNSTGATDVGIRLSWKQPTVGKNVAPMTGYKIYCRQPPQPPVELMLLGPEATELDKPLFLEESGGEDGTFSFYICATNALGAGPQSNTSTLQLFKPAAVAAPPSILPPLPPLAPLAPLGGPLAPLPPLAPLAPEDQSAPVASGMSENMSSGEGSASEGGSATCVVCGAFVPLGMKFCGNCGTKMN
jgi:hypothetical protein